MLSKSYGRRLNGPISSSGSPPQRNRRAAPTAKPSMTFAPGRGRSLRAGHRVSFWPLTHIDELRPANEWTPPYDLATSAGPKARNILAAIHSVEGTLDLPADAIVPVAMPPDRKPYNLDALWARIAVDLDDARLVQLDSPADWRTRNKPARAREPAWARWPLHHQGYRQGLI